MARLPLIEILSQDWRNAWRSLRSARSTTAVILVMMMLATGATTAIFAVVDAVALRRLPFSQSDRLVAVDRMVSGEVVISSYAAPDYLALRAQQDVFEGLAAVADGTLVLRREGETEPEIIRAQRVSAEFFQVLRVQPRLGRVFTSENEIEGRDRVAVISDGLWKRRFGGAPDVVGRRLPAESGDIEIIGVMPPRFAYPVGAVQATQLWTPYVVPPREREARVASYLRLTARLKDGVTLERAQAQLDYIATAAATAGVELGPRPVVRSLHESMTGYARATSLVLLAAVGCVLLLACANIANLLVVRATARTRELNVRVALGATRIQLARMLIAESMLLSAAGTALGVLAAWWGIQALRPLLPPDLPRLADIAVDSRVLLVSALTAVGAGIGYGLVPVVHGWGVRGRVSEDAGFTSTAAPRWQRLRTALLVGEIALAVVLLVGTALLLTSFARLMRVDVGLDYRNVLLMDVRPRTGGAAGASPLENVLARVSSLRGVESAAVASGNIPFSLSTTSVPLSIPGRTLPADAPTSIAVSEVSTEYFKVLRMALRSGRLFTSEDAQRDAPVILLNETAARTLFPREDPIGQSFIAGFGDPRTVIGIVGDVRGFGPERETQPQAFTPLLRATRGVVLIKTAGNPSAILPQAKAAIWSEFPDMAIPQPRLLEEGLSRLIAERRLLALLLTLFGTLGLAIAAAGIYGVTSFNVAQRTREFGLRVALGAAPRAILLSQLRGTFTQVAAGAIVGLAVSWSLTGVVGKFLYRVEPDDLWLYAAAGSVLAAAAFAAAAIPARRAARVDPVVALRAE